MKLGPTTVIPVVTNTARPERTGTAVTHAPEKNEREVQAAPAKQPSTDKGVPVSVSRMAVNLAQARQSAAADVDQKKVESVRTAIEKRTFKVNAEAIADKMLANAEEILRGQRN